MIAAALDQLILLSIDAVVDLFHLPDCWRAVLFVAGDSRYFRSRCFC